MSDIADAVEGGSNFPDDDEQTSSDSGESLKSTGEDLSCRRSSSTPESGDEIPIDCPLNDLGVLELSRELVLLTIQEAEGERLTLEAEWKGE
jgi:hypothetical protein